MVRVVSILGTWPEIIRMAPDRRLVLKDRPPRLQVTMMMRPIAGSEDGFAP